MENMSGKARLVFILFCCLAAVNIFWFMFRLSDDTVYEGPEEADGGYVEMLEDNKDNLVDKFVSDEKEDADSKEDEATDEADSTDEAVPADEYALEETYDFYYDQLSKKEQKAYDALEKGILAMEAKISIADCDAKEVEKAWHALLMDHIEIFWSKTYLAYEYTSPEKRVDLEMEYSYSVSEVESMKEQILAAANDAMNGLHSGASEYEKVQYVYEYIINLADYSYKIEEHQHIDSVFIENASVCAGYAKSTKYLLNKMGIECYYVLGDTVGDEAGVGHAWNLVKCEGDFYHLDSTWGDPYYQTDAKAANEDKKWYSDYLKLNHDFLCCSDEMMAATHTLNTELGYKYPSCKSVDCNYYVKNGRYLDSYDAEQIDAIILEDVANEKEISEFRFASRSAYDAALEQLKNTHWQTGVNAIKSNLGIDNAECVYVNDDNKLVFHFYWYYGR